MHIIPALNTVKTRAHEAAEIICNRVFRQIRPTQPSICVDPATAPTYSAAAEKRMVAEKWCLEDDSVKTGRGFFDRLDVVLFAFCAFVSHDSVSRCVGFVAIRAALVRMLHCGDLCRSRCSDRGLIDLVKVAERILHR